MRKLLLFSLILSAFAVSASEIKAQGVLREILDRLDKHNKQLQSLKAGVTMVKTNNQLGESDTNIGTTSYLPKTTGRNMYIRIDWTKPVEEQISVIGDRYELYRPRLNQVIQGKTNNSKDIGAAGGALAFMTMNKDQLKANYDVVYIGEEQVSGGVKTWHLQLSPKKGTSYKRAELWVDGDGMPRQAKVTEKNDDTTTVNLSNIQKNVTLKGEIFTLKYPGNVKKVQA